MKKYSERLFSKEHAEDDPHDDMPSAVLMVIAIHHGGMPVGVDTYNKCVEVIQKYPQYFSEEMVKMTPIKL